MAGRPLGGPRPSGARARAGGRSWRASAR